MIDNYDLLKEKAFKECFDDSLEKHCEIRKKTWDACWELHVAPKIEALKWLRGSNDLLQHEIKSLRQIAQDNQERYSAALARIKDLEDK